ncbi:MAG TPA: SDR family oxidoreductase [Burkholderiales bacterium]|nr:SDR family oxidoreductase [Burkholderiales bacterium]
MPTPNLNNKVALITGAAGGFGRVLVRAFLDHGARVAALDIDEAGLARLKREVPSARKAALLTSVTDIADYAACEKAIARTVRGLGGLDVLVNNGAMGMGVIRADHLARPVPIDEVAPEVWQRMVAVNFSGAWHMTRAAVPHMLGKRWGRIVNVTTSFFTMLRGGFHPYGPCKAGLEAMSAGHAKEFEANGVTVNVVVPGGPSDTPMVPPESGFDRKDLIKPEVMAPPILWLCSDAANGISGNRYVAAHWNASVAPEEAERKCRAPIGWPELAQSPVWPGGKPKA